MPPIFLSFQVHSVNAHLAKEYVDPFSVGHRRNTCIVVFVYEAAICIFRPEAGNLETPFRHPSRSIKAVRRPTNLRSRFAITKKAAKSASVTLILSRFDPPLRQWLPCQRFSVLPVGLLMLRTAGHAGKGPLVVRMTPVFPFTGSGWGGTVSFDLLGL